MQCVFDNHLRCRNTYFVYTPDGKEERISCWSEDKAFLEVLAEYFFDDGVTGLPWEKLESAKYKPVSNTMQIKHAEVYAWFNDELSPAENNIHYLEPWVRSGALNMTAERLKEIGNIKIYMDYIPLKH
jgi:hypothetical protein